MTDLVVVSLEPWDDVWRRNQHLVAGLLRRKSVDRVLFVEPPVDHLHEITKGHRPQLRKSGLRRVSLEGVRSGRLQALRQLKVLPRRWDPEGDRRRASAIAKVAFRIGFREPVLWINDPGGDVVLRETGWRSLYDITDDWLVADRPEREQERIRAQESHLLERCDAIVVCSPRLLAKGLPSNPAHLVPNAVDVGAYRTSWPRPGELPSGRVALYVGTLHRDRLDLDLTVQTAAHLMGTASVVLLGPVALEEHDRQFLRNAGVHLLGAVHSASVPAFLQHADVLILPHVISPFTESLDPIKAYEYKASGRPVVATRVPGFRDDTSGLVHLASGQAFAGRVLDLVTADLPSVTPSDVPDWQERVAAFEQILDRISE
ncbi:hypothetical protein BJF81_14640 [Ornithinimicrobium sp. CNJ-824]|uniref:glycosyltransferase n=1 Tax=Ornithinimicrobium sp. CNJ-824 TaxID=1904966 RepID=UPI000964541B|nr:glycosyltransferase [Ornithinimicrobium sp. CNJ-824]OLT21859.1 hypothetical protein BJF81_14640 [Ornithinimicrobium sp. CNJ-824]